MGNKPTRKNRYKKKRKVRRQKWLHRLASGAKLMVIAVVLLAASALFMAGYATVTRSDYFSTKTIEIKGNERLSKEAVLAQALLRSGDNLLAINLGLVRKRLLAHPWIAEARVSREIPERIHIAIQEQVPLAVVDLGRKFLLNTQGRIFKELHEKDPQELPLVTGIVYADISLGSDALTPAMSAVVELLGMSRSDGSAIAFKEIKGVHHDLEMGLSVAVWEKGRTIKMGLAPYEAKYRRLKQLLPHIRGNLKWRQFDTIDVNNPDRIVVKLETSSNKGV